MNVVLGLLLSLSGLVAVVGAVLDWDFFFEHPRAQFKVSILGCRGARIFYVFAGSIVAVVGVLIAMGVMTDAR